MRKLRLVTVMLLLTTTLIVFGQTNTEINTVKPHIEVTGSAEKEIIPDEIYIAITIRERREGKEKITIEKQETSLKQALTSIGISLDNLFLSDANANYIRIKWRKKDVITKTEYVLKVDEAKTVGDVFEKLDNLKINDAYISKVSHSNLEELKKEVRIMAIKAAKDKADYLLTAIGEQTGKPLIIQEVSNSNLDYGNNVNVRGSRAGGSSLFVDGLEFNQSDKDNAIQFQKIKLQAAIYVKFEIK